MSREHYMTIPEAAAALGVARSTLWKRVVKGEVKGAYRPFEGGDWRIPRAVIAEMRGAVAQATEVRP